MNEKAKKVIIPGPMISLHSATKLISYMVKAKTCPIEQTVGSFKCSGKRCQTCLNMNKMDTFTSTTTGDTYKKPISLIVTANVLCISILVRSV